MDSLDLRHLWHFVWRRKAWLVGGLVLGLAGSIAAKLTIPPEYQASTMILVEPQKIPSDYVKSTVTTSMEERLKTIEQQIKNRENLELIIEEMKLYPEARRRQPIEAVVARVRRDLTLQLIGNSVFRIYFAGKDPQQVAATANRVAELFIGENLRLRTSQAENTATFLDEELGETQRRLEEQEKKVAEFRIRYAGQLSEDRPANLQALSQLQAELQITQDAIDKGELRILFLEQQARSPDQLPATGPAGMTRLQQARSELQQLRSQFTDRHPDVIRLQKEIEQLEKLATESEPAEPAQPTRVDPYVDAEVRAQEAALRRLEAQRSRILGSMARYQRNLERIPLVEKELVGLTRDYENLERSYQSLRSKRIDARLSENLEKKRQSEQFTVLERAVPPRQPYSPRALTLLLIGLLSGGGAGVGLALLREQLDQTFADETGLREAFPAVRFLGSINRIKVDEQTPESAVIGKRSA